MEYVKRNKPKQFSAGVNCGNYLVISLFRRILHRGIIDEKLKIFVSLG
jgi:hypothetical protein